MDVLSVAFWSSLAAIVMIDLVLAGDNAIVIALAARALPPQTRTRAIVWGTLGAIVVRTALTLLVVWLLRVPGLRLVGSVLLIWIAWRLLVEDEEAGHEVAAAASFWGAMRTIVVADAIMGLDNVLAVAGAAHGHFLLVVLGLLISVPIMIAGSQLVLRFVDRYPFIVYLGGAVLAWTSAGMMVHEPLLHTFMAEHRWVSPVLHLGVLVLVMGGGFIANAWQASQRLAGHVVMDVADKPAAAAEPEAGAVLLVVDDSANSRAAARYLAQRYVGGKAPLIHLLHLAPPLSRHAGRYLRGVGREAYLRDAAEAALEPVRLILAASGLACAEHRDTGERMVKVAQYAERFSAAVVMAGVSPHPSVSRMFEETAWRKLLPMLKGRLTLVEGRHLSWFEQFSLGLGLGALLALLWRSLS